MLDKLLNLKELKKMAVTPNDYKHYEEHKIVLQLIEALEQEPKADALDKIRAEILEEKEHAYADFERYKVEYLEQESCDDCVSRQAAIDVIYDNEYKKDMRKELEQLPPVTPKEKIGHWIVGRVFPTKVSDENLIEYHCSECDRAIRCTESQLVNYPYCHCGAKMQEVENDTN